MRIAENAPAQRGQDIDREAAHGIERRRGGNKSYHKRNQKGR